MISNVNRFFSGPRLLLAGLIATAVMLGGCGKTGGGSASNTSGPADLTILSGSENKSLEPIIQKFAADHGVNIQTEYIGSVDMMLRLDSGDPGADAVWPANSIWIDLGDKQKRVKHLKSIFRSPVAMGVKLSRAKALGWLGKDVTVEDILKTAESGKLKFMMTSASQSNSGAAAYFGYLYAFAGRPDMLSGKDLQKPEVRSKIKRILGTVNRSAGSSGWLKDLFLQKYDSFDAMVNYESVIIEANQELVRSGREPLYCVYPVDGLAIADSPLGYVDRGDPAKAKLFDELQAYLLSDDVQKQFLASGRRTGLIGLDVKGIDKAVFNPDWGIDPGRTITPIRFPSAPVIRQALSLYQTAFRKPSLTVYCLDFSGSMQGQGETDLKAAMRTLLDQQTAAKYLLQSSPDDLTVIIPFDGQPRTMWVVRGNNPAKLTKLLGQIESTQPGGSTDIYAPVMRGLDVLRKEKNIRGYFPAVILMTDGQSNTGYNLGNLEDHYRSLGLDADVPVFAILFGEASEDQLKQITQFSSGSIFDGRKSLVEAFRKAKGYN